MTRIIGARIVKTVRNIEPKPWSQMSSRRSKFLVLDSRSWVWISSLRSWVVGPGLWLPGPGFCVLVHSLIITKCDKKLLQSVTGIINCDKV